MEFIHVVPTEYGPVTVVVTRKRMKNQVLKVSPTGRVCLSVPKNCPLAQIEQTVRKNGAWIASALAKGSRPHPQALPEPESRAACLALLVRAVGRVHPLVAPFGVAMPEVRIRKMRSQWGNCHRDQGYITLNTALARMPEHLQDYVALHELVHFLHAGHGPDFHASMTSLMPCWPEYKKELREYGWLIERE